MCDLYHVNNKKAGPPIPGNPAVPSNLAVFYKTHGFPSPPHDGFGFDQDEHYDTMMINRKSMRSDKKSRTAHFRQPGLSQATWQSFTRPMAFRPHLTMGLALIRIKTSSTYYSNIYARSRNFMKKFFLF
jgi:hypothetical protein